MTKQEKKVEEALLQIATKFDKWAELFMVAFATSTTAQVEKWYTPKAMALRLLKCGASVSPPELRIVCVALHGAVDCLGFSGALQLALELNKLRRKNGGKQAKSVVPGVRDGNNNNPKQ